MASFNSTFQEVAERAPFLATLTTILKIVCYRRDVGEYLIEADASVTQDYRGRFPGLFDPNPEKHFQVDQDMKNWCPEGLAVKLELEDIRLPVAKIMSGVAGDEEEKDSLRVFVWVSRSQLCQISPEVDTTNLPDFSTLPEVKRAGFMAARPLPHIQKRRRDIPSAPRRPRRRGTKPSDGQNPPRRSERIAQANRNTH